MDILRKYLWLVLPIVFFANYASADICENDPYACTPAKLCSKTTEKINNVLYWISSEEDKHLKVARKINLKCGAIYAMSSCQKDARECSILELCEVATTKEVSAINWNEINPQHVKLAKSFGLDCGVKEVQGINQDNKTNTFKSTSNDKTCSQDVLICTPSELCDAASYTINGITGWKVGAYKKYVDEAKRRNISCGVNIRAKNDKICSQDVLKCTPSELCDVATYTINKITEWKVGAYKKYVKEAKRRNISCGVKSANNKQVKADEKARLALAAEKKRKADEKARIALEAEKKRKADEKARLALKAEEKRKADEKARLALKAEEKRKADEKARLALKAEEKRKADEKARLALKAEEKRKADEKARLALKAEEKRKADAEKVEKSLIKLVSYAVLSRQDIDRYSELVEKLSLQSTYRIQNASKKICEAAQLNMRMTGEYRESICSDLYYTCTIVRYKEILEDSKKQAKGKGFSIDIFTNMLAGITSGALINSEECYILAIRHTRNAIQLGNSGLYIRLEDLKGLSGLNNSQNTNTGGANQMKFNDLQIRDPLNLKRYD